MGSNNSLREIIAEINARESLVVVSHYNPDADAYGSSCALTLALQLAGKKVVCVNENGALKRSLFIPGVAAVQNKFPEGFSDLLIAVDCGDARRIGDTIGAAMKQFTKVINIDHHASNDFFGTLNHVEPNASSSAEIILKLLEEAKLKISADAAMALFIGMSADTGSFRYSSTSAETFEIASRLIKYGAVPWIAAQELYANTPAATVKLQAEALSSLELLFNGKAALITVTSEMFLKHGADPDETDELKHMLQSVQGVVASAVIVQSRDIWRVSLRSRDPRFDVSVVAELFGGGGHKCAAAFRWRKGLEELKKQLVPALERVVAQS